MGKKEVSTGNSTQPADWRLLLIAACWALMLFPGMGHSDEPAFDVPVISLIIDDMGNQRAQGLEALALPGAVTYSFLPYAPFARPLAEQAHNDGKEVMLHLPMESQNGYRLGPGALTLGMTQEDFRYTLLEGLRSVPHVAGLNNHMGSLLTGHSEAMDWLMRGMEAFGELYFIDSRTTEFTVAEQAAHEHSIPSARRDVFLDHERTEEAVRAQFRRLIGLARQRGSAVGIGHPYPETLEVLKSELPHLQQYGVRLVTTSQLIDLQGRNVPWQASLSPSPGAAKSLRR